ncbi:PREDICTED: serpin B11 isoform X2 [Galeopterus variegatus]|uniref:Serpin B11 isoform X2 n=1 Tax=Galeopterus variegatus TaxID=482537 RepID=A0ABM0RVE7_GALVR|nr:PREDICTED: serpin B11 isoform X2 [Galeopterus variegatus]
MGSLSTANVEFCLDVFKELNSNNVGDNIFFSPLSLLYALSMVLLGARGNSAEQVEKVLHFSNIVESVKPEFKDSSKCSQAGRIHSDFGVLFSQINQADSNYTLSIANRLYGTKTMAFHQGKSIIVEMMYQTGMFKLAFIEEPQMQVLELPYVNNKLSMIILLPEGTANLEQVEKQLNVRTFHEWTSSSNMMEREVEVHIPRFKLEIKYELNSLLKSLGMTDVFNQIKADLSGISPAKGLYLSKVIHKSYVDVNEEGTEAAAAAGDSIAVKRLPLRARFLANHPFLFFIRHIHTNTILFFGKLASP